MSAIPRTVSSCCQLNTSAGTRPANSRTPIAVSDCRVASAIAIGCGFARTNPAITPPTRMPAAKAGFQLPTRQS